MNKIFSFCLSLFISLSSFSQSKIEVEKRVKFDVVPIKARNFINEIPSLKHLKWIKEISEEGTHFEAKFKKQRRYSVEFDSLGNLLDVEVLLSNQKNEIKFLEVLNQEFNRLPFVILKIQEQWTANHSKDLKQSIVKEENIEIVAVNYEIELKVKGENEIEFYELLLNNELKVIRKRLIEKPNTDNLIY